MINREPYIRRFEERIEFLTDENYHDEAALLGDVVELLQDEKLSDEKLLLEVLDKIELLPAGW